MAQVSLWSRASAVALAVGLVVSAAACSGGGEKADDTTTTTAVESTTTEAPTTTSVPLTEEEAVLAAYQAYWDTWLAANDPPNPADPELSRVMTGEALAAVEDDLAEKVAFNQVVRKSSPSLFRYRLDPLKVVGDEAVGTACLLDDLVVVSASTNEVLNGEVLDREIAVTFVREAGEWRVAKHEFQQTGDRGSLCDFGE